MTAFPAQNTVRHLTLLRGEILLQTRPHSAWGGAVTAQMYLPIQRAIAWQRLTDYPRWVQYFPDMVRSEVIQEYRAEASEHLPRQVKRLYQTARKMFFLMSVQVEAYLQVIETMQQRIQFHLERGSFNDFFAELQLQDYDQGTLLTYSVQATPTIPVPSLFIEQAMQMELPQNMRTMRQILIQGL